MSLPAKRIMQMPFTARTVCCPDMPGRLVIQARKDSFSSRERIAYKDVLDVHGYSHCVDIEAHIKVLQHEFITAQPRGSHAAVSIPPAVLGLVSVSAPHPDMHDAQPPAYTVACDGPRDGCCSHVYVPLGLRYVFTSALHCGRHVFVLSVEMGVQFDSKWSMIQCKA